MIIKIPGNILILTHWSFKDALIQTYTLPYVDIIRAILPPDKKIILVTSEQNALALSDAETLEINSAWKSKNMMLVTQSYQSMGIGKVLDSLKDLRKLHGLVKKEKVAAIHCFCTPAGTIGFLLSKLSGAKLVIDSYEPHAESMIENGTWKKNGFAFQTLFLFEKWQSHRAACFISTSEGMRGYAKEKYGIQPKNFFVKPACVDLGKFYIRKKQEGLVKELGLEDKIVCVYAGKLGGIYLKEEVFDFIAACYEFWGDKFRFVMLTNAAEKEVAEERERVGLPTQVVIRKFVKHEEVPDYLSLGDFALNPVKPVPTKQYCTSIKDGEYWAMGLPVVITRNISDDSAIISKNKIGYELKELSKEEYRNAITTIDQLLQAPLDLTKNKIRNIAEQYRGFQIAENIYKQIYS